VLFVDIAGSTGLAERLGGKGIHRFLDRTFQLLTLAGRGLVAAKCSAMSATR